MPRPVYGALRSAADAAPAHGGGSANAGLVHEKFVDCWKDGYGGQDDTRRKQFLGRVAALSGSRQATDLLREYHSRRKTMAAKLCGRQWSKRSLWRLVAGMGRANALEIGFNWDHRLGVPRLPGSSIKGAVRAWAEICLDPPARPEVERIFGGEERAGTVVLLDAYPVPMSTRPVTELDVMNVHYKRYYESGGARPPDGMEDPTLLLFLAAPAETEWTTWVLPRAVDAGADAGKALAWLERCAAEWGLGAKTNVGYGYFGDGSSAPPAAGGGAAPGIPPGFKAQVQNYRPSLRHMLPEIVAGLEGSPNGDERRELAAGLVKKLVDHPLRPEEKALLERVRALAG